MRDKGLVTEVADDALTQAMALAEELATRSPAALASIKQLMGCSGHLPLEEALRRESLAFYQLLRDDDTAVEIIGSLIATGADLSKVP